MRYFSINQSSFADEGTYSVYTLSNYNRIPQVCYFGEDNGVILWECEAVNGLRNNEPFQCTIGGQTVTFLASGYSESRPQDLPSIAVSFTINVPDDLWSQPDASYVKQVKAKTQNVFDLENVMSFHMQLIGAAFVSAAICVYFVK